jgi:hypothetical protein
MHAVRYPGVLPFYTRVVLSLEYAFNEIVFLVTADFGVEEDRNY